MSQYYAHFVIRHDFVSSQPFGPAGRFRLFLDLASSSYDYTLWLSSTATPPELNNLSVVCVWSKRYSFFETRTLMQSVEENLRLTKLQAEQFIVSVSAQQFPLYFMITFHKSKSQPSPAPHCSLYAGLVNDLERFMLDQQSKDVKFLVENQEIDAHKQIVAARSEVFAAMFSADMVERRTNRVALPDISVKCFKALLRFIYTNECDSDDASEELLYVADKYAIEELKVRVADLMLKTITCENALSLLILFDRFQVVVERKMAFNFVVANKEAVLTSARRYQFQDQHPKLAFEVYNALCFGQKNK